MAPKGKRMTFASRSRREPLTKTALGSGRRGAAPHPPAAVVAPQLRRLLAMRANARRLLEPRDRRADEPIRRSKSDAEACRLVDHMPDCNRHRRNIGVHAALDWLADNPPHHVRDRSFRQRREMAEAAVRDVYA